MKKTTKAYQFLCICEYAGKLSILWWYPNFGKLSFAVWWKMIHEHIWPWLFCWNGHLLWFTLFWNLKKLLPDHSFRWQHFSPVFSSWMLGALAASQGFGELYPFGVFFFFPSRAGLACQKLPFVRWPLPRLERFLFFLNGEVVREERYEAKLWSWGALSQSVPLSQSNIPHQKSKLIGWKHMRIPQNSWISIARSGLELWSSLPKFSCLLGDSPETDNP